MLSWELRSYALAQQQYGPVFFDRGVPDVVGYLRLMNLPVPAHVERAAASCHYHRRVFIAPPWPEIFAQDRERKQDFAEATRTCDAMVATYADFGYELVELPRAPLARRVDFVLEKAGVGTVLTQTHA
jgi:predicted ATPase